ncbi:MAG: carboxypeptidase regulatory-like domain-containing protein [Pirellulaceae bacterium]|nr:carboxypeptidase regulatory-like domain-containing protein [Pirellulaceae bacterium]
MASTDIDQRHITLFDNADKNLGDIRLSTGRVYRGQIVNSKGAPIAEATVTCSAHRFIGRGSAGVIAGTREVITDNEGRFVTPTLPLAIPHVQASAVGFAMKAFDTAKLIAATDGELGILKLAGDDPIEGTIVDKNLQPLPGISVQVRGLVATTDERGRFALRGLVGTTRQPISIRAEGFAPLSWLTTKTSNGYECVDFTEFQLNPRALTSAAYQKALSSPMTMQRLQIQLRREGMIFGNAVDEETGEPITLSRVVLCNFARKPNGKVVLSLCRKSHFTQPTAGKFVVGYPVPNEYHLTVSANGYEDAEAFTPKVSELQRVDGIEIKMRRKGDVPASTIVAQHIRGVVKDDGDELKNARVALWRRPRNLPAIATRLIRGRTSVGDGSVVTSHMLTGPEFSLEAPVQDPNWYVLVETPDRIVALHGPIDVAKGETQQVEIETRACGRVEGVVSNASSVDVPLWVVLFSGLGIQYEVPIQSNGRFELTNVFPGDYGLKVGCDSILDSDLGDFPYRDRPDEESFRLMKRPSNPWKRAVKISVEEAQTVSIRPIKFER